jgi:hypothetical protein
MEAYKLEVVAVGRCNNCRRFRNNMPYKVGDNVVCIDCFTCFKNQRLIDSVIDPEKEKEVKPKPVKVKPVRVPKQKPVNIKTKSVKVEKQKPKKIRRRRINDRPGKILEYIKRSEKPVRIIEIKGLGSQKTVYNNIKPLLEQGRIVAAYSQGGCGFFIDAERSHLLTTNKLVVEARSANKARCDFLDFVESQSKILTVNEIAEATGFRGKRVIEYAYYWQERGKVEISEDNNCDRLRYLITAAINTDLVQEIKNIPSFKDRVRQMVINAGREGETVGNILSNLGRQPQGGSQKFIRSLLQEWGCKKYRRGNSMYYYFDGDRN